MGNQFIKIHWIWFPKKTETVWEATALATRVPKTDKDDDIPDAPAPD